MIYTQSIFLAYILFEIIRHGEASLNYQHLILYFSFDLPRFSLYHKAS